MENKNVEPVIPPDPNEKIIVKRDNWGTVNIGKNASKVHKYSRKDTVVSRKDQKKVRALNISDSLKNVNKANIENKQKKI